MGLDGVLSLEDPTVKAYVFYGSILVAKTLLMAFWTARHRIPKKVFGTPEDYGPPKEGKPHTIRTHPDVERVRRAHQNDLENIPIFLILGLISLIARPPFNTIWIFRIFTAARIIYTLCYLNEVKIRPLVFGVGVVCTFILFGGIMARIVPLAPY